MKPEWRDRLRHIEAALMRDLYHPLGEIELSGFVTTEELSLEQAQLRERSAMPCGKEWGEAWQYAWMFGEILLPEAARGERIVMNLDMGGEATLFVDGHTFGTRRADWVSVPHHFYVDQWLTCDGAPGTRYQLAAEVYAGHPMPVEPLGGCATGPVFPEDEPNVMRYAPATMGKNSFGIWNEEAYQLWLDVRTLHDILEHADAHSLRVELIEHGLNRFSVQLDMEQPLAKRREAYKAARAGLASLMQAHNGSSAPLMYGVGNAHLDVCWLWNLPVTRRKTARTFAQQLRLLDEYPESRFFQSQPVLYEMCREYYPDVFEGIKRQVAAGRWIADGAMWVEPDTNMPCGEALVRQFLYGKRYFEEVFGVDSRLCWLPDTFGYSAVLPQILAGCDVDYLTTQKIFWTYNDADRFPHHAFTWQGMDGTRVRCYLHMEYESKVNAGTLIDKWNSRVERDGTGKFLLPFGYGDGGGGPTRDDYEQIRREADLEGVPRIRHSDPSELFCDLADDPVFDSVYVGELYFQCHRGTYTVQAAVKRGNRRSELKLRAAELLCVLAAERGMDYPAMELERCWKLVLLNQFHDILPGSSIARVYEEAAARYAEVDASLDALLAGAQKALVEPGEGVTLVNTLSHKRRALVKLPDEFVSGAVTREGKRIPTESDAQTGVWAMVELPAMGQLSLMPAQTSERLTETARLSETDEGFVLENSRLRATIGRDGTLKLLIDLASGEQRVRQGNVFHFYRDVPRKFDAWDIDCMTSQCEIPLEGDVQMEPLKREGLWASLKLHRRIGASEIQQVISLRAGANQLDFDTEVDWHELHKLLKVEFATGIYADEARNQIQYGFVKRPTHSSRPYDADRFEVCNHQYTALCDENRGAAVLNDCKYGVSMSGDAISLTLLRAGAHPDFRTDQGKQRFKYSYDVWTGDWLNCPVVDDAAELNEDVLIMRGAAKAQSYMSVDAPNVIIDAVKLAEDGSGDMILRLYESKQAHTVTVLRMDTENVECIECNMLERKLHAISPVDGGWKLEFRPFEVKTLRIKRK